MDYPHLPTLLGPKQRVHTFRIFNFNLITPLPKVSLKHPDVLDFKALAGPINGSFVPITLQGHYKVGRWWEAGSGATARGGQPAGYK